MKDVARTAGPKHRCVKLIEVTLWGTASWLQQLPNTLNPSTRGTLRRIGSLLGLDVVRRYQDGRGVSRLAGDLSIALML